MVSEWNGLNVEIKNACDKKTLSIIMVPDGKPSNWREWEWIAAISVPIQFAFTFML